MVAAQTLQAVYGQMRFILPRIALKLRVNYFYISYNSSICVLQYFILYLSIVPFFALIHITL